MIELADTAPMAIDAALLSDPRISPFTFGDIEPPLIPNRKVCQAPIARPGSACSTAAIRRPDPPPSRSTGTSFPR